LPTINKYVKNINLTAIKREVPGSRLDQLAADSNVKYINLTVINKSKMNLS
jgi:hypothetical protein